MGRWLVLVGFIIFIVSDYGETLLKPYVNTFLLCFIIGAVFGFTEKIFKSKTASQSRDLVSRTEGELVTEDTSWNGLDLQRGNDDGIDRD